MPKVIGKLSRALGITPDMLQKHPNETSIGNSIVTVPNDEVSDEEIERVLSTMTRLRARGTLTEQQIDEVARDLIRQLIIEERNKKP